MHSITDCEPNPECPHHDEDGMVCEDHPDQPWYPSHYDCGAGMFCPCTRWACGSVGSDCACVT